MCDECDAVQYIVAGDFNCEPGSRFYPLFQNFATENNLCLSDSSHLSGIATYYNDAGTVSFVDRSYAVLPRCGQADKQHGCL